jgi:hypothetical protein
MQGEMAMQYGLFVTSLGLLANEVMPRLTELS